jgi:hypothetical protein
VTEFEQYIDLIDTTLDSKFSAVPNLRWTPWVGKRFQKKISPKLLIVGESHYAKARDNETIEEVQEKEERNKELTREVIWECPISKDWKNPTLDKVGRIFVGDGNYKRRDFWQDVAFYNFVQRMVHYVEPPERPSENDFTSGWVVFYDVLRIVKPDYCVFLGSQARHTFWSSMKRLGIEFADQKRSEQIGRCWSYRAEIILAGRSVPIVFIQHPGKYFSSPAWHDYLLRRYPIEIAEFKKEYGAS